jgi:hypothetical protein
MKCSNPDCNRGIGLVAYRRRWFIKHRYCSRHCRDAVVADAPKPQQKRSTTTYFEWLFEQPILTAQPKTVPAAIRARSKPVKDFGSRSDDTGCSCTNSVQNSTKLNYTAVTDAAGIRA